MFYSSILLSALAATAALAAPTRRQAATADSSIRVQLSGPGELAIQTAFVEGSRQEKRPVGSSGPFNTVSLEVGKAVRQQGLRCQVRDKNNKAIVVLRNGNRDTTFADGDAGSWSFEAGNQNVLTIICDPAFVKGPAPARRGIPSVRVQLSGLNELAIQTAFEQGGLVREVQPANIGDIQTVQLNLDPAAANQALRCQILDQAGAPITLKRGQNIDTTFADGDAGAWTLIDAAGAPIVATVSDVICDPVFAKGPAPAAGAVATPATGSVSVPSVRVQISGLDELAVQRTFALGGLAREVQNGVSGDLTTIELFLDAAANPALRCQAVDAAGKVITVMRGQNVDTSFADGGKGLWKFIDENRMPITTSVSQVICDPAFKANSA